MKPSLQLRVGQSLTMTPQLQQAIRLLQLSTLELNHEIQEALETNPMLEQTDSSDEDAPESAEDTAETTESSTANDNSTDTIPDELPTDSNWDDIYESPYPAASLGSPDENHDMMAQRAASADLHDHLSWQLNLASMNERDELIAVAVIDAIDDDGYLRATAEDIMDSVDIDELESDEVEAVIHRIQQFEPAGVGARSADECILIQLRQYPEDTPGRDIAIRICTHYFDLLASRNLSQIKRRLKIKDDNLDMATALIRAMHPRPGASIASTKTEFVIPDVIVHKTSRGWQVNLNPDTAPKLRINSTYAGYIKRADQSADNQYLKNNLNDAKWFIKSLKSRHDTLLSVATKIVELQRGFFDYGPEAMKPLVLRDIADSLEMHESTISRATTRKYMLTPRGTFEFKYFFSSHVNTSSGGECSATAIRALIKKLVAAERPDKPLSDNKISTILADQDIEVARRTVAKYRESMGIPSSSERKRLA